MVTKLIDIVCLMSVIMIFFRGGFPSSSTIFVSFYGVFAIVCFRLHIICLVSTFYVCKGNVFFDIIKTL